MGREWLPRTLARAIIRWRKHSPAGAIRHRTVPICCSRAQPKWELRQHIRLVQSIRYFGHSFLPARRTIAASAGRLNVRGENRRSDVAARERQDDELLAK